MYIWFSVTRLLGDRRYMNLYPERIVFISGAIDAVTRAQSSITMKQHTFHLRSLVSELSIFYAWFYLLFYLTRYYLPSLNH